MSGALSLRSTVALSNGIAMPIFGLGTWQCETDELRHAVSHALKVGYTHLDCADNYFNHGLVAQGMKDSGVPREDIFITSKVWNTFHHSADTVEGAMRRYCKELDVSYIDLMFIHWPRSFVHTGDDFDQFPKDDKGNIRLEDNVDLRETWKGMERCLEKGLCRAIGLSNFDQDEMELILSSCKVQPTVCQIESHPYFPNNELLEFCKSKGIHVTAYCPLGNVNPEKLGTPLNDPVIKSLAEKHGKTPANVILRWGLQRGVTIIPKSVSNSRIEENANIFDFELSGDDMDAINKLGSKKKRNCNPAFNPNGGKKWPNDTSAWLD